MSVAGLSRRVLESAGSSVGGAAGKGCESSGWREGDLLTGHLRNIHSAFGFEPRCRPRIKGLGDISGAMDDTYNFNAGLHLAVVDGLLPTA